MPFLRRPPPLAAAGFHDLRHVVLPTVQIQAPGRAGKIILAAAEEKEEPNMPVKTGDEEFLSHIVSEICDYAVRNGYEPNDTLKTISENIMLMLEIATFNNWKPEDES